MRISWSATRLSRRLQRALRDARRDRRGNFTVLFAISSVALILLIGIGVDYVTGLSFKSRWDTATDASALAAIKAAEAYVTANSASQSGSALTSGAIAAGEAQGYKAFAANSGASEATETVTPTVNVTVKAGVFTANVTYVGSVATHFGGLVGIPNLSVQGYATASSANATYINYYIVVDTSQSMGIGSTQADETNLYNLTQSMGYTDDNETGCVFGCHVATYGRPYSNEDLAHNANPPITLRIDAARTAIQDVVAFTQKNAGGVGNVKIGLYAMQLNPNSHTLLTTISAPTNNYGQLTSLAAALDLGTNTTAGFGDSDMVDSLTNLSQLLTPDGNGLTAATPLNFVIVITDGVMDLSGPCNADGHCTGPLPTSACSALQANAKVGVIYTTYLPLFAQNNPAKGYEAGYSLLVQSFAGAILPNLQACASNAALFYQADDGPALIADLQSLFAYTLNSARLTQ